MTKNPIGILQGRLSPPVQGRIQAFPWDTWEQEFFLAKDLGIEMIDWIIEAEKFPQNPLISEEGMAVIKSVIARSGVSIGAVCADFFIDCPLIRCSGSELKERLHVLEQLIERLSFFKIKYLEIPFVDNSAIKNCAELERITHIMAPLIEKAYQRGVIFAFETSLPPDMFVTFLNDLDHPAARANYDMGNSASLGYDPRAELEYYGEKVVTVHVKDRILDGGTVPLGEGNADFSACFSLLKKKHYTGPFFLQVARGADEIEWNRKNLAFVKTFSKTNSQEGSEV